MYHFVVFHNLSSGILQFTITTNHLPNFRQIVMHLDPSRSPSTIPTIGSDYTPTIPYPPSFSIAGSSERPPPFVSEVDVDRIHYRTRLFIEPHVRDTDTRSTSSIIRPIPLPAVHAPDATIEHIDIGGGPVPPTTEEKTSLLHSNLTGEYESQPVISDKGTISTDDTDVANIQTPFCACVPGTTEENAVKCDYCVTVSEFMHKMKKLLQIDQDADEISFKIKIGINKRKRDYDDGIPVVKSDEAGECCICLDNHNRGDHVLKLDCFCTNQYYHQDCIGGWLTNNTTCPTCRKEVPSVPKKYKVSHNV